MLNSYAMPRIVITDDVLKTYALVARELPSNASEKEFMETATSVSCHTGNVPRGVFLAAVRKAIEEFRFSTGRLPPVGVSREAWDEYFAADGKILGRNLYEWR